MLVFLSYSNENIEYVEWLRSSLSRYLKVFFDNHSITGGSEWERDIDNAIRGCKVFIPVVTKESNDSQWVTRETLLALSLQKPIVPVLLSDSLPLRLIDRQFVDFRESFETGISDLLTTLSKYFGDLKLDSGEIDILIARAIKERLKGNIKESNALVEQFVGPNSGVATDGYWFWTKLREAVSTNYAEKYKGKLFVAEETVICSEQVYEDCMSFEWSIELHGESKALDLIDSVVYTLHPTFKSPVQKVRSRSDNFRLVRIGWGVFKVKLRISFIDYSVIEGGYMLTFKEQNKVRLEER